MSLLNKKLSIFDLSKTFLVDGKPLETLSKINLHVNRHEFVSIIGPSGCGKSTLFHILAGIERDTEGKIFFDGKETHNRRGKSGYMFQDPLLLPWRSVLDNLVLGMDVKGIPRRESRKKAMALLEEFGLLQFRDVYPSALSGGMKQRVAMLRTLLFGEDFLLLDEPFGALDALTRLTCQLWLLDVWQKRKSSILFITHDISEAILLSNRIYVLSRRPGRILKELTVGLPYPRRQDFLTSPKAVDLEKKLYSLLIG